MKEKSIDMGYLRIASASPAVTVASPNDNVGNIIDILKKVWVEGAALVVYPEMCITGYTCGDLFHDSTLLAGAEAGLAEICRATAGLPGLVAFVGMPVKAGGLLYNCCIAVGDGRILAAVPKTYVPNYNEFYEHRWWTGADPSAMPSRIELAGLDVPFGTGLLLDCVGTTVAMEVCEDLWATIPPSCAASLAGAEVIVNLSASDDLTGKYEYLRQLIAQQSARCLCAYAYAGAGFGESSTDLVFDGKTIIAESGRTLAANKRWQHGNQWVIADVDLTCLRHDRLHNTSFARGRQLHPVTYKVVTTGIVARPLAGPMAYRSIDALPFVPAMDAERNRRCEEIVAIQASGLAKRLTHTSCKCLVVGISGGLDSTLALLVAVRAFDMLGLDRKGIKGVTMPGFGTTDRTHNNATDLMQALGIDMLEIKIADAVNQHFKDIDHDPANHDVTYENSQARERTQILMDLANKFGGMVLGTGDMSELALGWATYNGDHMSMYGVNAGVPKTLVRHLVRYFADTSASEQVRSTLLDIADTPISPELIPAAADGTILQKTEDLVGPYPLHDFFLYNMLRHGLGPRRIYAMACKAFGEEYEPEEILKWLRTFYRRFFAQQFKRSCLPDGPKVGSICLSPRGDWRMPSDASAKLWLDEIDSL